MKYNVITTDKELRENGLLHIIICNKNSNLYGKEFLSVEAAQIAGRAFGEKVTEKDCNFFTKQNEVNKYEYEKWKRIKEKEYPGFIGVWTRVFCGMAEIDCPY